MYVLAKNNSIVALDAATGKEIWTARELGAARITTRGINYWESKDRSDRRLLFASNQLLQAIDAQTGEADPVVRRERPRRSERGPRPRSDDASLVQSTTPGRVFENLLILGSATNQGYGSAPGDIRAFDVRTGKLVWTFHTIPHPASSATTRGRRMPGKPSAARMSGASCRSTRSAASSTRPPPAPNTTSTAPNRKGANLFGDCLLALDARTGKRLWHFQMVHHDIWDYDDATAPKLLTVRHDGKMVDVVAQVSKQGFLWVFNRVTGEPLWPIEERPVPAVRHARRRDLADAAVPDHAAAVRAAEVHRRRPESVHRRPGGTRHASATRSCSARNEGLFTPPGLAQHDPDARQQRRRQLGRSRGRSGPRARCSSSPRTFPAMLKLATDPRSGPCAPSRVRAAIATTAASAS